MTMKHWYVIQTKPRREEEVNLYLSNKGLEMFFPLMETFILKHGGTNRELKPLFPSYIFGRFNVEEAYPLVKWARGVKKILGFGGYPTSVADEVVKLIKDRTDENKVLRRIRDFKPNDVIRVNSGPLKDLLGVFERWTSDGERVRVLLNLIGYQPAVELHHSMLEKVA
jgi:transcriptional antiterminator RfaH